MDKIIKIRIFKAEINDNGYQKIDGKQEVEVNHEGKKSREFWEDMGIAPTPENCYDFHETNNDGSIELNIKDDFSYWEADFYFRLSDFKYLEVDLDSEGEQIIILTLQDGTEIAVSPESLENLEKSLNIGEAENLTE